MGGKERGRKSGGGVGLAALSGGWRRGKVSALGRAHSLAEYQLGWRGTFRGSEGNVANVSPSCLGPGKPVEVLGLNPDLREPPHSRGTNGDREGLVGDRGM